ncbi:MAG TPA: DUF4386 domain-containing protein [Gemmatimonadales bacterium]|nr:DUF4386 domain-containing protein [Gemmatimonadales bacterium]
MTRATNARIAGFTFLFYIVAGVTALALGRATKSEGLAERLSLIAGHATQVRITILLSLVISVTALTLAISLYALTRDVDRDVAVLACACRIGEGMLGAVAPVTTLGLLWLATTAPADTGAGASTLGSFLRHVGQWNTLISAILFSVGSTLFSWLFLRGRLIPVPLAWLGVLGSALLVVGLPLQLAGFVSGPLTQMMWVPVAVFELTLGPWLLVKGVR